MTDSSLSPTQREFQCPHCSGKIRIPRDLPPTTGPCPLCNTLITSPALEVEPQVISPLPPVPSRVQIPEHPPAPVPVPQPIPQPTAQQVAVPAPAPPVEPAVTATPAVTEVTRTKSSSLSTSKSSAETKSLAPVYVIATLLLLFAGGAFYALKKGLAPEKNASKPAPATSSSAAKSTPTQLPEVNEARYIRDGWQKDAYSILDQFLHAKTAAEKLPYIINSAALAPQVTAFYAKNAANDLDTPADTYSVNQLAEEDRKRGIFMMIFDQPPQFDIKDFFRPLATLEVQYGISEADILLSTVARIENFATDPLRVAAFFKRTPEGLKLDWETFVQTKYRTLRTFTEIPDPGKTGVFRVIIAQDVPDKNNSQAPGAKTYRLVDPVSPEISPRIELNIDSDIGKTLSSINWIGEQGNPVNRTATVELKWSTGDQPELQINRFICWEFLNLGAGQTISSPPPR